MEERAGDVRGAAEVNVIWERPEVWGCHGRRCLGAAAGGPEPRDGVGGAEHRLGDVVGNPLTHPRFATRSALTCCRSTISQLGLVELSGCRAETKHDGYLILVGTVYNAECL